SNQTYIDAVLASDAFGKRADPFINPFVTQAYALSFSFSRADFLALYESGRETVNNIGGALGDEEFWRGVGQGLKQFGEEEWEAMKDNARQLAEELANGEYDEVSAAIITLRVALMVPVARRYIGRSAEPLIKFLQRYGDKPVAKHVANALLKVLKPLLKGDVDPLIGTIYGMVFIADITEL